MIHYSKNNYNCAHHAVNKINEAHGLSIAFNDGDEWQASFVPMLRRLFTPIKRPQDKCLVVMSLKLGGLHLGYFENWHVEHNYNPIGDAGCVIKSDLGTIRSEYKKVRFYAINKAIS